MQRVPVCFNAPQSFFQLSMAIVLIHSSTSAGGNSSNKAVTKDLGEADWSRLEFDSSGGFFVVVLAWCKKKILTDVTILIPRGFGPQGS